MKLNKLEIKNIRKELKLNQTKFGALLGVSMRAVQSWESGERNMPESTVLLLKEKIDTQSVHSHIGSAIDSDETEQLQTGVPYYNIDFTASFLEVENNQVAIPDSYISHPFFKGCDYVVRASGQSMAKLIAHGDAIGLIKIENWQAFFPLGEVYAIVTKNGFRMIKVITKGETKDTFTLVSKPTDNKKDEFPTQQIKINQILSIFKVQASSHLF